MITVLISGYKHTCDECGREVSRYRLFSFPERPAVRLCVLCGTDANGKPYLPLKHGGEDTPQLLVVPA